MLTQRGVQQRHKTITLFFVPVTQMITNIKSIANYSNHLTKYTIFKQKRQRFLTGPKVKINKLFHWHDIAYMYYIQADT